MIHCLWSKLLRLCRRLRRFGSDRQRKEPEYPVKLFPNEKFIPLFLAQMAEEGATGTIIARGYSMMPFIEHNRDRLVFAQVDRVRVGDVVLAEISKGVFVCHRVERLDGDRLTMRGDGNVQGTEQCRLQDVRARLITVIRKNKTYNLDTSTAWKVYSFLWPRLLPLRRYLLALYRLLWQHKLPRRFMRG